MCKEIDGEIGCRLPACAPLVSRASADPCSFAGNNAEKHDIFSAGWPTVFSRQPDEEMHAKGSGRRIGLERPFRLIARDAWHRKLTTLRVAPPAWTAYTTIETNPGNQCQHW